TPDIPHVMIVIFNCLLSFYSKTKQEEPTMSKPTLTREELASYLDHTLLKPEASRSQIKAVCDEAKQYHFASVCVNPCWIPFIAEELKGSGVTACSVIGFPLGATLSSVKAEEAKAAVAAGAGEIDMVINV